MDNVQLRPRNPLLGSLYLPNIRNYFPPPPPSHRYSHGYYMVAQNTLHTCKVKISISSRHLLTFRSFVNLLFSITRVLCYEQPPNKKEPWVPQARIWILNILLPPPSPSKIFTLGKKRRYLYACFCYYTSQLLQCSLKL